MKKSTIFVLLIFVSNLFFAQSASEKTIYLWYSGDGTTFSNETYFIDSCDVPSIVQDSSGLIIATYQAFKGGISSPSWDRIGVRFSSDNGMTWTSHQPINLTGFPGSSDRAFDPTITVTETGQYRLYFSYCPNTMMLDSTCDTYSAISSDGINYTFEPGVRMSVDNKEVIDPATCYFNGVWYYVNPIGAPSEGGRSASSTDGLNFTVNDTVGESGPGTNWTGNLMDNGATMRFYGGSDNAHNYAIWWNETSDGINWTGYNWTNVEGNYAKDPGIWKLANGEYLMLVSKDSSDPSASIVEEDVENIKVHPNPANDIINIDSDNRSINNVIIFSADGKVILNEANPNSFIDISSIPQGVYILIMELEGEVVRKKFIKQ